jgi:hypothetical protein
MGLFIGPRLRIKNCKEKIPSAAGRPNMICPANCNLAESEELPVAAQDDQAGCYQRGSSYYSNQRWSAKLILNSSYLSDHYSISSFSPFSLKLSQAPLKVPDLQF